MSLKDDLQKMCNSVTVEGEQEYQKFKRGELKLQLIGDTGRGYYEADKWECWCDRGKLILETYEYHPREIPFILAPVFFYNPIFKKVEMIPFEIRLKKWIEYQEHEKKYRINTNKLFLYEYKDDHVVCYDKKGKTTISEEIYEHLWCLPDDGYTKMRKEEFFETK